ncbi:MAG: Rho termination factor N-terminal domain-containing protein [Solirubrobacterales bacterium]
MSAVLDIDNLLESPLADLHALAGELDIEGYRLLRKSDLTIAILESRGAIGDEIRPAVEAKASELARIKAERERELAEQERIEDEAREAAAAERAAERGTCQAQSQSQSRQRGGERTRGSRGGRGRGGRGGERSERGGERKPRSRGEAAGGGAGAKAEKSERGERQGRRGGAEKAPAQPEQTVSISGIFEPGSGGGGRLRVDLARRVRGDADVPRGEVRKWKLHRGDSIVGEARKMRRGRTDHQLVSITSVNGQNADQRANKSVRFGDAAAAGIGDRWAKRTFKHAPVGAGSRLVVTGPTRAAASEMTRKLAGELAGSKVVTALVIVASRPEDAAAEAAGFDVIANEAGKAPEDVLPALELALDRGRRIAESGGDAAVLVDGLDLLPPEQANEIFNSAKNLSQHGSLTVVAAAGSGSPLEAQATAIGVVSGGRRVKLDKKASWTA